MNDPAPGDAKLVILTNYVSPPRLPVFEEIARRIDTTILVDTPMEENRKWPVTESSLRVKVAPGFTLRRIYAHPAGFREQAYFHLPAGLFWLLPRCRPTHILSGELGVRTGIACLYRLLHPRVRLTVWVEGTPHTDGPRGKLRSWWRKLILRAPDGVVATSHATRELLLSYGVKPERIAVVLQASALDAPESSPVRSANERKRLLFCGQLALRKGLRHLMPALNAVCARLKDLTVEMWLAGHGNEEQWLKEQILPSNLKLAFLGHVPYSSLPEVYKKCGIFVFPTLADVWGLVVNEAMAHGLPVAGSRYSQAVCELIEEGKTGWTFRPDDPQELETALFEALTRSCEELERMGEAARERAARLTPERFAAELLAAALGESKKNATRLAILTNFVPPTRAEAYERIAARVDTTVLVDTLIKPNRGWPPYSGPLRVQVATGITIRRSYRHPMGWQETVFYHLPFGLLWRLFRVNPTHILSGELGCRSAVACCYKLLKPSTRLAVVVSGTAHTDLFRGKLRTWWRRALVRVPDAIVATSTGARELMLLYGAPPSKVSVSLLVGGLQPPAAAPRRTECERRRLLFCGRLVPLKGLREFVPVLAQVCVETSQQVELWIAGKGEEERRLKEMKLPGSLQLRFLGDVPYSQLPAVYRQCGILVFPTFCDVWGVVVNEAMAYSMPVLGSRYSQAVCDLVEDGVSGWTFFPDRPATVLEGVRRALAATTEELESMGQAARRRIAAVSPERFASDLLRAVLGEPQELQESARRGGTGGPQLVPGPATLENDVLR